MEAYGVWTSSTVLEGVDHLLLVDALETDKEARTLLRLEGDEVPSFLSLKMSPHKIGAPDMLFAAKLKGLYPHHVVLWGVQPECLELSPTVAARVDVLVEKIVEQLNAWGHFPVPITAPTGLCDSAR